MLHTKRLEEIQNEISNLRKEEDDIEKKMVKENEPILKKHIGKCYKVRNSYGSGDDWWLYRKIIGINGKYLVFFQFESTSKYHYISEKHDFGYELPEKDWIEITLSKFDKQFKLFVKQITKLSKGV